MMVNWCSQRSFHKARAWYDFLTNCWMAWSETFSLSWASNYKMQPKKLYKMT
jgi:hypothetical protein